MQSIQECCLSAENLSRSARRTLSKLLKDIGIAAVPHGFQSSFRDWAGGRNEPWTRLRAATGASSPVLGPEN